MLELCTSCKKVPRHHKYKYLCKVCWNLKQKEYRDANLEKLKLGQRSRYKKLINPNPLFSTIKVCTNCNDSFLCEVDTNYCNKCHKIQKNDYRKSNIDAVQEHDRSRYRTKKKFLDSLKEGKPCLDCGGVFHHWQMEYDHRPGTVKIRNVSNMKHYLLDKIMEEIAKCDLVCSNCHQDRTYRRKQQKAKTNE